MATVIFVHGTGVREPIAGETFNHIKDELTRRKSALEVVRVYWGGTLGTQLFGKGGSIPDYDTARGETERSDPKDVPEDKTQLALWQLLCQDSLYEIRLLALIAEAQSGLAGDSFVPGRATPGQDLLNQAQLIGPRADSIDDTTAELYKLLLQGGLFSVFAASRDFVVLSPPAATAAIGNNISELQQAIARAIVAEALFRTADSEPVPRAWENTALRDEIVEQLINTLANAIPGDRGPVTDWVKRQVVGLASNVGERVGTWYIRSHRGSASDKAFGFPGDIMLYQARGKTIRDAIAKSVENANGPVILVGHSLGGVACVDTLIERALPKVAYLVTVGSQAPLFYEMNTLVTLPFQDIPPHERLPGHFPNWMNFYDKSDFLSYIGAKLFGPIVQDILVDNKMPFPDAHSGYWHNSQVYDEIVRRLP